MAEELGGVLAFLYKGKREKGNCRIITLSVVGKVYRRLLIDHVRIILESYRVSKNKLYK